MRPRTTAFAASLLIALLAGCTNPPNPIDAAVTPLPEEALTASQGTVGQTATTADTGLSSIVADSQGAVKAVDAGKAAEAKQRLLSIQTTATSLSKTLAAAFASLKSHLGDIATSVDAVGRERDQWLQVAKEQQARADKATAENKQLTDELKTQTRLAASEKVRADKAEARADSAARKWFAVMAALGGAGVAAGILLVWLLPGGTKMGLMIAGVAGVWTAVMLALIRWYEELAWAGLIGLIVLVVAVLAAGVFMVVKRVRAMQAAKKAGETAVVELVELNEEQKKRLPESEKEALFGKPGESPWLAPARNLLSEATVEMVDKARVALGVK